jgi:hypothetical protein
MSAYKDIKKNANENGIILDYCGSDERYYYNGLYIDLCGMSIEDYIKSTQFPCCGGSNGEGGDTPVVKTINTIIFTKNSNGYLVAYTEKTPSQDIVATCVCEGINVEFIFKANSSAIVVSNVIPTENELVITDVTISPEEDEKYKYGDYSVINVNEEDKVMSLVWTTKDMVSIKDLENISNISISNLTSSEITENGVEVTYVSPEIEIPTEPEGLTDNEIDAWWESWYDENSFIPILFVEKDKFNEGLFKIGMGSDDLTNNFIEIDTKTIDGIVYSVIVEKADGIDFARNYNGNNIVAIAGDNPGAIIKYVIKY